MLFRGNWQEWLRQAQASSGPRCRPPDNPNLEACTNLAIHLAHLGTPSATNPTLLASPLEPGDEATLAQLRDPTRQRAQPYAPLRWSGLRLRLLHWPPKFSFFFVPFQMRGGPPSVCIRCQNRPPAARRPGCSTCRGWEFVWAGGAGVPRSIFQVRRVNKAILLWLPCFRSASHCPTCTSAELLPKDKFRRAHLPPEHLLEHAHIGLNAAGTGFSRGATPPTRLLPQPPNTPGSATPACHMRTMARNGQIRCCIFPTCFRAIFS